MANENRIAGVYKITNKINNKVYIGESLNVHRRWKEHRDSLRQNQHHSHKLQSDYNKYGSRNFIYEIIETIDNNYSTFLQRCILLVYEESYIKQYNSIEEGYNIEYTIDKMLNKEKGIIYEHSINNRMLNALKSIKKNIEVNGKYIKPDDSKQESPKKTARKKKEFYLPPKMKNQIKEIPTPTVSIREYLNYMCYNYNYKLTCKYNDVFKNLRELNIMYYDENKINKPCKEYTNIFKVEKRAYGANEYEATVIDSNKIEDFLNILLTNNIIFLD